MKILVFVTSLFSVTLHAEGCGLGLISAPSSQTIDEFVDRTKALADELGFDDFLFIANGNEENRFRQAFTSENYKRSWSTPVPAGPLTLFEGRLYPSDFYRKKAYARMGMRKIDNRPPHEIGLDQFSINTKGGNFVVEKNSGSEHLLDFLFRENKPVTVYRGVRGAEAEKYDILKKAILENDVQLRKTAEQQLKEYSDDPSAGCFVTTDPNAAVAFGIREAKGRVIVYTLNPQKVSPQVRVGIYMGIETKYFEIALSSREARSLLIDSYTQTTNGKSLLISVTSAREKLPPLDSSLVKELANRPVVAQLLQSQYPYLLEQFARFPEVLEFIKDKKIDSLKIAKAVLSPGSVKLSPVEVKIAEALLKDHTFAELADGKLNSDQTRTGLLKAIDGTNVSFGYFAMLGSFIEIIRASADPGRENLILNLGDGSKALASPSLTVSHLNLASRLLICSWNS